MGYYQQILAQQVLKNKVLTRELSLFYDFYAGKYLNRLVKNNYAENNWRELIPCLTDGINYGDRIKLLDNLSTNLDCIKQAAIYSEDVAEGLELNNPDVSSRFTIYLPLKL